MEHSRNYLKVKRFFGLKLWDARRVRDAVGAGWITEEEYSVITGDPF